MVDGRGTPITVVMERRADGGLFVYSDDVPGLMLSHLDPHKAYCDIIPALETLLSDKHGHEVKVEPMSDVEALLIKDGVLQPEKLAMLQRVQFTAMAA